MGIGAVPARLPEARNRSRTWSRRICLIALCGSITWSISGRVEAEMPGSDTCVPHSTATAEEYLTGDACPPDGFADTLGYEPVLMLTEYGWRYTKPGWAGGFCSPPLTDHGPFWDFESACRTHDYGYDLVRFGVGDRAAADRLLYRDMTATCMATDVFGGTACRAMARWANAALRVGDVTGFDPEPF
jgi:hypothetical protein